MTKTSCKNNSQAISHTLYKNRFGGAAMIDLTTLKSLASADITSTDRARLADIREIKVDEELPADEKIAQFIGEVKNPYCFLVGDVPIKIRFKPQGRDLKNILSDYFVGLK